MRVGALIKSLALLIWVGVALVPPNGRAKVPVLKRVIVNAVIDVDVALEKRDPPNLVITATGEVPTSGYTDAKLHQPPKQPHS